MKFYYYCVNVNVQHDQGKAAFTLFSKYFIVNADQDNLIHKTYILIGFINGVQALLCRWRAYMIITDSLPL